MLDEQINEDIFTKIFSDFAVEIPVIIRSGKTKGEFYDKFRKTGYEITNQNPLFIRALTKAVAPNSLIIRELGLTESGAYQIIVQDDDVALIKLAQEITIDGNKYTPWLKALGSRIQIFPLKFGYTKILIFRMNDK